MAVADRAVGKNTVVVVVAVVVIVVVAAAGGSDSGSNTADSTDSCFRDLCGFLDGKKSLVASEMIGCLCCSNLEYCSAEVAVCVEVVAANV